MHLVAEAAQILRGLAGAARAVVVRMGEPVAARGAGDGLELLAGEEPVGQVAGEPGVGFGDVAVLGMGSEAEVSGQRRILIGTFNGALRRPGAWAAALAGWWAATDLTRTGLPARPVRRRGLGARTSRRR